MDCQLLFGHDGLFIEKQIDIMNLIPYELFEINPKTLKCLKEHYTNRKIKEYFNTHGELPNSGTIKTYNIPPQLMEEYKQYYYAGHCSSIIKDTIIDEVSSNGYEDLGLPSGLLWAKCNVGAKHEYEFGNYFAWGETEPKEEYGWETYKFGSTKNSRTKYNSSDGKTILEPQDDAATVNMGEEWRMPTEEELEELVYNTSRLYTSINGIKGIKFINRQTPSNYIFIPAAGYVDNLIDNMWSAGRNCSFWTATFLSSSSSNPYAFFEENEEIGFPRGKSAPTGLPVRGVRF